MFGSFFNWQNWDFVCGSGGYDGQAWLQDVMENVSIHSGRRMSLLSSSCLNVWGIASSVACLDPCMHGFWILMVDLFWGVVAMLAKFCSLNDFSSPNRTSTWWWKKSRSLGCLLNTVAYTARRCFAGMLENRLRSGRRSWGRARSRSCLSYGSRKWWLELWRSSSRVARWNIYIYIHQKKTSFLKSHWLLAHVALLLLSWLCSRTSALEMPGHAHVWKAQKHNTEQTTHTHTPLWCL